MGTMIPTKDKVGKCPYCRNSVRFESSEDGNYFLCQRAERGVYKRYMVNGLKCPECEGLIITLITQRLLNNAWMPENQQMLYPLGSARPPVPLEVPEPIAQDYKEACLVEPLSQKATAALARRCLQNMLRDPNAGNVKPSDLSKEIDQAISKLPTALAESIDAVRNVGNFGTHPIKCQHTGEIVDVEPQEAEWLLDTLEELFDHYYVKPQRIKQKRDALNKKLTDAGKPPLK